jgi:Asp/Glu/hydantoin racemase
VLPQPLEIGDVVGDRVGVRILWPGGVAGPARIEEYESEMLAEPGEIAEIERREAGAAAVADE